jgi:hypothetical protein
MAGSTPLEQWRQGGRWPECLDRIWKKTRGRYGKSGGTRDDLPGSGWPRQWVGSADQRRGGSPVPGGTDAAAVLHIMQTPDSEERRRHQIELSEDLAQFERPQPVNGRVRLLLRCKG